MVRSVQKSYMLAKPPISIEFLAAMRELLELQGKASSQFLGDLLLIKV